MIKRDTPEFFWKRTGILRALGMGVTGVFGGFIVFAVTAAVTRRMYDWIPYMFMALPVLLVVASVVHDLAVGRRPLARFTGKPGSGSTTDPLAHQLFQRMRAIHSPRLRVMVRKLVARGLTLRANLVKGSEVRQEMTEEVEHLLIAVLKCAEKAQALESSLESVNVAALYEQMKILDERMAATSNTDAVEEMIARKTELQQQLALMDERQHQMVQQFSKLLEASTRLSAMNADMGQSALNGSDSMTSLSTILRELNNQLDAHRELDQAVKESPPR